MTLPRRVQVLILGAGPAGIEAALRSCSMGFSTALYEAEQVGAAVQRWRHVRMFSPWGMNRSPLGVQVLRQLDSPLAADSSFPTGLEFCRGYLEPLARSRQLAGVLHTRTRALAASRRGFGKGEAIGANDRLRSPFRVTWRRDDAQVGVTECDILIDATGVFETPADFGAGGSPVAGLATLTRGDGGHHRQVSRHLPDVLTGERERYANRHCLLIGSGYSAATCALDLLQLRRECAGTQLTWLVAGAHGPVYHAIAGDPLPERARLAREANRIIERPPRGCEILRQHFVDNMAQLGNRIEVTLCPALGEGSETLRSIDEVVALVGYRPDLELLRELQVHICYATDGLMKLSAALLGAGGDCLKVAAPGAETLRNPEPGLYVIGSKSFGRNSSYLLRAGLEQVDTIFGALIPALGIV